jgi:hypothetical protein
MKKIILSLAGLGIAAAALPATADAAPWNLNGREARVEARIDQGVRSGALNRFEAQRLRGQLREIERLEVRYTRSRPGLTPAERGDLERRLSALEARVFVQKHDRQHRW